MSEPSGEWQDEPVGPLERDGLFQQQANGFLDAMEGKAAPACSLREGLQTLRVNLAILESVKTRQWRNL